MPFRRKCLSIITINYNQGETLERTMLSIVVQRSPDIEYLLIDGGSTDESLNILERYRKYVDYFHAEPVRGISRAYNTAIKHANGDYIFMVAADDWLKLGAVDKVLKTIESHPHVDIFTAGIYLWKQRALVAPVFSDPAGIPRESTIQHAGTIIKKSLFERIGLFDEGYKLAMDYEFFLRAFYRGARFLNMKDILANKELSGLSQKFHRQALLETFVARKPYEHVLNLHFWYLYSLIKDWLGRLSRKYILTRRIYRCYWCFKKDLIK